MRIQYYPGMSEVSDKQELDYRMELLEKDFKIMEANIDCTLNTMRTDIERINSDAPKPG